MLIWIRLRSHVSDAPGPSTAPHTAPVHNDFAGMRMTLDEILSELRAQRESQDERDRDMNDLRRRQLEFMERTQLDMRDIVSGMVGLRGDVQRLSERIQDDSDVREDHHQRRGRARHH